MSHNEYNEYEEEGLSEFIQQASVTYDMQYGDFASVMAQKSGEGGTVICEIFDGDKLWLTSISTAAYGIASCSGFVGQK